MTNPEDYPRKPEVPIHGGQSDGTINDRCIHFFNGDTKVYHCPWCFKRMKKELEAKDRRIKELENRNQALESFLERAGKFINSFNELNLDVINDNAKLKTALRDCVAMFEFFSKHKYDSQILMCQMFATKAEESIEKTKKILGEK